MATTKAKKRPVKATSKPKKTSAKGKKTAKKAVAKPEKTFEIGQFVTFNGYNNDVGEESAIFKKDDILYIIEMEKAEADGQIAYGCILASDIADYEDDAESVDGGEVVASEITLIRGARDMELREQYVPVALIGEMPEILKRHDGDLIAIADELNAEHHKAYFYLGGVLAKILQEGSYLVENGGKYEGEDAFNDFCEEHFGFKHSKGRDLARIYTTYSQLENFSVEMLEGIGWSFAKQAQRFVTSDNVEEVLETAKESTQRELPYVLKEKFTNAEGKTASGKTASRDSKIKTVTMTFKFQEAAADGIQLTIQHVMKEHGLENEAAAVEHIIMDWASHNIDAVTVKKRIAGKFNKATREAKAA